MSRTRLVVMVLPLAVMALHVAGIALMLPRLPDPVATHFGPDGAADGFLSPGALLAMFAVFR